MSQHAGPHAAQTYKPATGVCSGAVQSPRLSSRTSTAHAHHPTFLISPLAPLQWSPQTIMQPQSSGLCTPSSTKGQPQGHQEACKASTDLQQDSGARPGSGRVTQQSLSHWQSSHLDIARRKAQVSLNSVCDAS